MSATLNFTCKSNVVTNGVRVTTFAAVIGTDPAEQAFWAANPSGTLSLSGVSPFVVFTPGKNYTLTVALAD